MAPKRLLEDPPPASSSEEEDEETEDEATNELGQEEEEESSEESEEEEEENDTHQNKNPKSDDNTPPTTKPQKPSKNKSDDDDEDDSESETESDTSQPSPSASAFTIKPIASKPMKESVQVQPQKKSTALKTVSVSGGVKRSKESESKGFEKKDVKKRKVGVSNNGQDEDFKKGSSGAFSRLWSEEDEVAILKGMIDYQNEKGSDPWADLEAFLRFIKENLHVDVNKDQLKSKIKRLKLKYQGNVEKGKDFVGKEHDSRIFDLSKKIWGGDNKDNNNGVANESAKKKRKPATQSKKKVAALELPNGEVKVEPVEVEPVRSDLSFLDGLLSQVERFGISESVMKEALPLMGSEKIKELESKLRKFQEEELRLCVKKAELVRDIAKLVLEAMK